MKKSEKYFLGGCLIFTLLCWIFLTFGCLKTVFYHVEKTDKEKMEESLLFLRGSCNSGQRCVEFKERKKAYESKYNLTYI